MVSSDYRTRQARWAQEDAAWREVLALTEQQPQPVNLGGFTVVVPELTERPTLVHPACGWDLSIDGMKLDDVIIEARGHLYRRHDGAPVSWQPEPVSRGELVNLFTVALPINAETNWLIDRLLFRFTITRKQPEGADHDHTTC